MATSSKAISFDLSTVFETAAAQFRGLNPNQPGQWPLLPKLMAWSAVGLLMVVAGWFMLLSGAHDALDQERAKEPVLKQDYRSKLGQAVNLAELRKQKRQVEEFVTQLEKQLPGKAEMDALLSDINQAGLGRGLQFELFRPGQVVVKDYYAELPRIVTLHNLVLTTPSREAPGMLAMEATARTYRYLDLNEIEEMKKIAAKAKAGAKK